MVSALGGGHSLICDSQVLASVLLQEERHPRPLSKSVFGTLDTVSAAQPTAVLRRKRAHTGFSFDHPGFESHFADEVCAARIDPGPH